MPETKVKSKRIYFNKNRNKMYTMEVGNIISINKPLTGVNLKEYEIVVLGAGGSFIIYELKDSSKNSLI